MPRTGWPEEIPTVEALPNEGFLWLDFVREDSPDWGQEVARITGVKIHDAHVIDSLNEGHPSFFDSSDTYEMLVFQGLVRGADATTVAARPTTFFLLPRALVTVRPRDSHSAPRLLERFEAKAGRVPREPSSLMHQFLNLMVDRFMALREPLRAQIEEWQRALLDPSNPFGDWMALMDEKGRDASAASNLFAKSSRTRSTPGQTGLLSSSTRLCKYVSTTSASTSGGSSRKRSTFRPNSRRSCR